MPTPAQQSTPVLGLPYILPAQALSYITHNEALRALDLRVQTRAESRTLSAPPDAPEDGLTYIVPDPQGDWSAPPNSVMRYQDGGYLTYPPSEGWLVWLVDEALYLHYDGTSWESLTTDGLDDLRELGINATADATNRLAVASDAVLFTHNGTDQRCILNKAHQSDTASFLFQNGFQGHAEFGLIGTNDFALKTSANGTDFKEVFHVDASSANLRLPDSRQLEFEVNSGNKVGFSYIRIRNGSMSFEKPSSDISLDDGTAFLFAECGGQETGNPFWQGLHLTSTTVNLSGNNVRPRTSFYWRYTDKANPDDLAFVIEAAAGGLNADIKLTPGGQGAVIADTVTGLRVGSESMDPQAMLDVQGAVRIKTYTLAALPSGQGSGALAMVSNAPGGLALAFFDGTDWRTVHDRQTL